MIKARHAEDLAENIAKAAYLDALDPKNWFVPVAYLQRIWTALHYVHTRHGGDVAISDRVL
jgi:hypothetical protein